MPQQGDIDTATEPVDSLAAILSDWLKWLGPNKETQCRCCGNRFEAPENSNAFVVEICRDCYYRCASVPEGLRHET